MDIIKRKHSISKNAEDNHKKIVYYDKLSNVIVLILGKLLKENEENKYYKKNGYNSFSDYIANSGFSFTRRTAYNYIDLWNIYEEYKISYDEFVKIPYSKVLEIKNIIDKDNYEEWFAKALTLSRSDLKIEVKEVEGNEGQDKYIPMPKIYRCAECSKWKIDIDDSNICKC